jgi:steroid delta-isomerase-like uncharacterized protein
MSVEQNKQLFSRFVEEVWGNKNLEAIESAIAADCIDHMAMPGMPSGLQGIKARHAMLFAAFPDAQLTIEELIGEGDKVVARWTIRGRQQQEFMGIPATGKQITITGIGIYRFAGGKFAEIREQFDQMGMMQQLGVFPAPGQ